MPALTLPSVSVVVVSRHRPRELALCLGALALQDHPAMEVIVVADPAGLAVRPDLPARRVGFDRPNISAARNLGIAAAAGEVVAFIDDDAVAEPDWASRLSAAFADPAVVAAGGRTRGPHGRSWQMEAEAITPDGPVPLPVPRGALHLLRPADGTILGLLGTNSAIRQADLLAVGGFDEAFSYHLDESDLALRLAARFPHRPSAWVRDAEVTHGTRPSERRSAGGAPRDLTVIGQSEALFAARHGGDPGRAAARIRARLVQHMLAGRIEPPDVDRLMTGLRRGMATPPAPPALPDLSAPRPAFQAWPCHPRPARLIAAPWRRRVAARAQAAAAAARGEVVTLLLLTPSLLPHRTSFTPGGWWEQHGGLWGASQPDDPFIIPALNLAARASREGGKMGHRRNPASHQPVA